MVKCLFCENNTKVINSRKSETFTRRRRSCLKCNRRFTTYERAELILNIIKKNGKTEPFDREKLRKGILRACEKRPVTLEQIDKTIDKIEKELRRLKTEIKSDVIGNKVISKLQNLDKVAYIRFASVYKNFEDVDAFKQEIKKLS